MSTTLSTNAMITMVQKKTGIGLGAADCMERLNEGFRFINEMQQGGFIWQLKTTTVSVPGTEALVPLPNDFDPGKTAVLRGDGVQISHKTAIPYMSYREIVNEVHFQSNPISTGFTAWTIVPNFSNAPSSYSWSMKLAPPEAFLTPMTLPFMYHAVNFAPLAQGNNVYFPTPDQFDSLIVDLAVAEIKDMYRLSGAESLRGRVLQRIGNIIDTYRSDRFDLAGLMDQTAQAQEKNIEKAK